MNRLIINVIRVSETWWSSSGQCTINEHTKCSLWKFKWTSKRVLWLTPGWIDKWLTLYHRRETLYVFLREYFFNLILNQCKLVSLRFMCLPPTNIKTKVSFCHDLRKTLRKLIKEDITIIMGGEFIGSYRLGLLTLIDEMLNAFATAKQMVVLDTFFELSDRHLHTLADR